MIIKYRKGLNLFLRKYLNLFIKRNISEPENSLFFILMKTYKFEIRNYNYFKRTFIKTHKANKVIHNRNLKNIFTFYFAKRLNNYPLQYILGQWFFRDFIVNCTKPVLIPRIETEKIVDLSYTHIEDYIRKNKLANDKIMFLEVGVGSGVIFISVLKKYKHFSFTGLDIDPRCIKLSQMNAVKILPNITRNFNLINSDLQDYISSFDESTKFDFLVSNPPYIGNNDETVMKDVIQHECHVALFSGSDGLDLIKVIINNSRKLVKKGGFVILETNENQQDRILNVLIKEKFHYFLFEKDIFERNRFVIYYVN